MPKKYYLCVEMSWKGLISRMSDECLITLETVVSYCYDYQAVMRKFTLAGKTFLKTEGEVLTFTSYYNIIGSGSELGEVGFVKGIIHG